MKENDHHYCSEGNISTRVVAYVQRARLRAVMMMLNEAPQSKLQVASRLASWSAGGDESGPQTTKDFMTLTERWHIDL